MHIHPAVASVVGQVSENRWGQVLQTPHAYGVIQVYTPDGIARQKGVEILTKLTRMVSTPPVSLSALSLIADDVMTDDVTSLILLVPVGAILYLVCRGKGAVYLKRADSLAVLLDDTGALSGEAKAGDTIIAASAGFVDALPREEIMGVFDHLSASEVAERLTILLHEQGGAEGGAALIFHIEKLPDEPETLTEPPVALVQSRAVKTGISFWHMVARSLRRFTNPRQRTFLRSIRTKLHSISTKHIIAGIIIFLFLISVLFGMIHQRARASDSKIVEALAQAQHAFDEGMALADLNPVKGRERLTQAKALLAPVIAKKSNSPEAKKAQELYGHINENLTQAMHVTQVKPELFFDVALLKSGASASEISLFEDTLGILDRAHPTVYMLDVTTKRGSVVAGGVGLEGATQLAAYSDAFYALGSKGITSIRLSDQKSTPNVIPAVPEWGNVTDIVAYGGNLYLLDIVKSRIWKYVATEKGFNEMREYLNPDAFPDLSATTNMVIDGSVWLGSIHSVIPRFTLGKENSFTPKGVEPALGKNLMVYTGDETKLVYVLDKDNHRVVVIDKEGIYLAQYKWDSSFIPTGFVVSEKIKRILLLSAGKIYTIGLE